MEDRAVRGIQTVIRYIESRLGGRLELETVAKAVHYSKYHLHRMFTETVGMTLHDYVQRRRLTEAAKLLAFSRRPISQIALQCGYESQQSFSQAFKSMYKAPPAAYRAAGNFYPLQLPFTLRMERGREAFRKEEIRLAEERDIPAWMELMRLVIDGYPAMDEGAYLEQLRESIRAGHALVLGEGDTLAGALAFSTGPGRIEFLGVHPPVPEAGAPAAVSGRTDGDLSARSGDQHHHLPGTGQGGHGAPGPVAGTGLCPA